MATTSATTALVTLLGSPATLTLEEGARTAASGCYSQTAAWVYSTRVAVIRTVSKFMTNEPP